MVIHPVRPPSPHPHPHDEHKSAKGAHVAHHDMDSYAIADVHKKNRHEPKKGRGIARKRLREEDSRDDDDDDDVDGDD
jgi:hypothetical protein